MDIQRTIRRHMYAALASHLSRQEISLIIGPRQAGKTTLMKQLQQTLMGQEKKTIYLNLDVETDNQYFISQQYLINKLNLEFGNSKAYVFIDEIQRKTDAGLFLKGIYDLQLPYKFIVSGSGSVELKEKVHESLAGRKRLFELYPLSFWEYVDFQTNYAYTDRLSQFFDIEQEKTALLFENYLQFGGYPQIVLNLTIEEKRSAINEIFRSYVEKDVIALLKIERVEAFKTLVQVLASQLGSLIHYGELSNTLGISLPVVHNYLWYLEKTFIIDIITPYFNNKRKELTKSPVVYFYDFGLRNFSLNLFGNSLQPSDMGFLFQNYVYLCLKEKCANTAMSIHFWRSKDNAEVDFVVQQGMSVIPIEVKLKKMIKPEIERSMRSFITIYKPLLAYIVNRNLDQENMIEGTTIKWIPYWKLYTIQFS